MKAKLITVKEKFEIRLENGKIILSDENEKKEDFLKRVEDETILDVGELEITELKKESFDNLPLEKLKTAREKQNGLLAALIDEAIEAREVKESIDFTERFKAATSKRTLKEVTAAANAAKVNVGRTIEFKAHSTGIKTEGVINGVWVDKRVPMAVYRIFDDKGKIHNKTINSPNIKIGEFAPKQKIKPKKTKKVISNPDKSINILAGRILKHLLKLTELNNEDSQNKRRKNTN